MLTQRDKTVHHQFVVNEFKVDKSAVDFHLQ